MLAKRLKKKVSRVVSNFQYAFVEGRQIFDVVLIANEAIDSMLKSNKSGGLYRLDIEKRMTMLIETFYLRFWKKWALGKGGSVGLVSAFHLQGSRL